ncbi:hypothetical protein BKA70DRAFT_1231435 [Coprinopsis sp. MPI-PUGE-AT-0042]|nr:hypothetical protein BKA70DRAFT_1231435 [Coprinopsis sp. MPI-PUGE-AT-0042]
MAWSWNGYGYILEWVCLRIGTWNGFTLEWVDLGMAWPWNGSHDPFQTYTHPKIMWDGMGMGWNGYGYGFGMGHVILEWVGFGMGMGWNGHMILEWVGIGWSWNGYGLAWVGLGMGMDWYGHMILEWVGSIPIPRPSHSKINPFQSKPIPSTYSKAYLYPFQGIHIPIPRYIHTHSKTKPFQLNKLEYEIHVLISGTD